MILVNKSPPPAGSSLEGLYRRMPIEGLVHSSLMLGEHYEQSAAFDEDWSCPAVTWSMGGEEHYALAHEPLIRMRSAGALTLAAGARYSYAAATKTPFVSNMIVFPRWITRAAAKSPLENRSEAGADLTTRLFLPDPQTEAFMYAIADRCRHSDDNKAWYAENAALLYDMLIAGQRRAAGARRGICAVKPSTRSELARRIERAQQFMLQTYDDAQLNLKTIAREACLSRFHLIRVFKALTGETPTQFLTKIRMYAARRLLRTTRTPIADVAVAVGYRDRSAFFRAFRKQYGAGPSALERP